jgi:hypothetical protein
MHSSPIPPDLSRYCRPSRIFGSHELQRPAFELPAHQFHGSTNWRGLLFGGITGYGAAHNPSANVPSFASAMTARTLDFQT